MNLARHSLSDLYRFFDLAPSCSDGDLRQAYRRLLLANHPDLNPNNIEAATKRTQEINNAYSRLKEHREKSNFDPENLLSDLPYDVSISFDFSFRVDLKDISRRKNAFSEAYEAFQRAPHDTITILRLIHAAFEAERYKEIRELLKHPVLIDASALLIKILGSKKSANTLIRWADQLRQLNLVEQAVQILEDAYLGGITEEPILDELRSLHYCIAQGYWTKDEKKPAPPIRIKHLLRILEIGFDLDYIHKLLAEAYYEAGDIAKATIYLKRAYEINPKLSGAVKISRALGLLPQHEKPQTKRERVKYKFTRPDQIPHPSQIRTWAAEGNWNQIFPFTDLNLYSPRIIPSARSTIRQIAASLGDCPDDKAIEILRTLQTSVYWDVRDACESSLERWGQGNKLQVASEQAENKHLDVEHRLWNMIAFETYHPASDEYYLTALAYLSSLIFAPNDPDEILGALRKMTRWLEKLGLGEMAQWLRDLIRREAPGTYYVDSHDRENYVQKVQISGYLQSKLDPLLESVKSQAPIRLAQVLNSRVNLRESKTTNRNRSFPDKV